MGKKTFVAVLATLMCTVVFAMGSKDIEKKELGEVNSWDESFDINTKKNGKWNVLVTAEDKAGNIAEAGPFNIWLDPASDLPIIGITNPAPNLRVPGHLNIVGTCSDDDAVSYVSLILDGNETAKQVINSTAVLEVLNISGAGHEIKIIYGGDGNYNGKSLNDTFYIKDLRTDVRISTSNIIYGNALHVKVTVSENATGNVTVTVGKISKSITLENGVGEINITGETATVTLELSNIYQMDSLGTAPQLYKEATHHLHLAKENGQWKVHRPCRERSQYSTEWLG